MDSCLLLHLMLLWLSYGSCAEILEPPQNQTLPLNATAAFTCTTSGPPLWEVDSIPLLEAVQDFANRGIYVANENRTSTESHATLLVDGVISNNGTTVKCITREGTTERVGSELATLQLFSRPTPPTDLSELPVAPLQLNLSWNRPWSLPEVEITYQVKITNLNTSQESESEELRTTYYVFIGEEEETRMYICDMYKFSVNARNDAGESDQSGMIISSLPTILNITHSHSMQSLTNSVMFKDGNVLVRITFEHAEVCEDYPVQYYSVMLNNSETQDVIWAGPYLPSGDGDMEIHLDSSDGVQENVRYLFTIVATNEVGNGTSEEEDFYTTDVQYAEVSLENRTANVTCTFAEGTEALGCHVELRPINSRGNPLSVNISRANGSYEAMGVIPTSLPAVCYDVLVRDWEADGTRGELNVPVDITPSEEGSEDLCFEPTGSSATTEPTSLPPSSGNVQYSYHNSEQSTQNSSSLSSSSSSFWTSIIVGGVSGGVAVLIVVVVVLIVTVLWYYKRKTRKGFITTENNPAYELPQLQGIATSRHLHTTTLSATGVAEEPSDNHEYEDIFSMSTNAAYDTPSRL